jgi:peptide/nickel transport system permease protein
MPEGHRSWIIARIGLDLALTFVLTVAGLIIITFIIGRFLPTDPVVAIIGDRAPHDVYLATGAAMGLDRPIWVQLFRYAQRLFAGDFGKSVLSSQPVLSDIGRFFPATIELATLSTLVAVLVGVPLGVIAAARERSWLDHIVRVVALIGYSVPVFWLGLVGLLIFYARLGWVAGPGRIDITYQYTIEPVTGIALIDTLLAGNTDAFVSVVKHTLLPVSILGLYSMAYITRMTRSFMLDQLAAEYVTAARVKGLHEGRVIWRHAFANIAAPLVTVIALAYANLLSGSVLTETIFAWPGVGLYITQSLFSADLNAVLGGTIVIGVCYIAINLAADALGRLLDPRTRAQ